MTDTPDLSAPSLAGLSYALRHMKEVAPGHEYSHQHYAIPKYRGCGTAGCALGLCQVLWPETFGRPTEDGDIDKPEYFGRPVEDSIFSVGAYPADDGDVTPTMVADRTNEWLAEHGETRG